MLKLYDILDQEAQSHKNCTAGVIVDKKTGELRFCKTILLNEASEEKVKEI